MPLWLQKILLSKAKKKPIFFISLAVDFLVAKVGSRFLVANIRVKGSAQICPWAGQRHKKSEKRSQSNRQAIHLHPLSNTLLMTYKDCGLI